MLPADYDRLLEYYVLLWTNIKEARKAGLLSMLLSPVNIRILEQALPAREVELWRERQSNLLWTVMQKPLWSSWGSERNGHSSRSPRQPRPLLTAAQLPQQQPAEREGMEAERPESWPYKLKARTGSASLLQKTETLIIPGPSPVWWMSAMKNIHWHCALFSKTRALRTGWKKELCTFCFCHLDTKCCWSLGNCMLVG
jgi:hypothetical protein